MLYFIEGEKTIGNGTLEKHGLDRLLCNPKVREQLSGPGGRGGVVVADESFTSEQRFAQQGQTWSRRFGFDGTWVGFWDEAPPGPESLARANQVDGPEIELLDGNRWKVPVLREWRDNSDSTAIIFGCKLPSVLKQDPETGRLVPGDVVARYRDLWSESCKIADDMLQQLQNGSASLDSDQLDRFMGDLLSTNYRVSVAEIGLLGLLDEDLYRLIVQVALDWDHMMELAKNLQCRLDLEGGNSPDTDSRSGETQPTEELKPTTDPPSEN